MRDISKVGNLTLYYRQKYLKYKIEKKLLKEDILYDTNVTSLYASNDLNDKIYFWQLYSVLGEKKIHNIIKIFYENIFNDIEELWFRDEFVELGSINHHILGQKRFWLDVMGGGIKYQSEEKLNNRHKLVENIMTKEGAERWMYHMYNTLNNHHLNLENRIKESIIDFCLFFIELYSIQFHFSKL